MLTYDIFGFLFSVYASVISDYGVSKNSLCGLSLCLCGNGLFFKGVVTTAITEQRVYCQFITHNGDLS